MNQNSAKKKILFVCTHNSARSQMAEGILKTFYGDRFEVYSAGTEPKDVNPNAVKAMAEIGVDISMYLSKSVEQFHDMEFDYVITLCDKAKQSYSVLPGAKKSIHKTFDDPQDFSDIEEELLSRFRQLRDEISEWIEKVLIKGIS
jgi:arsenate reductase